MRHNMFFDVELSDIGPIYSLKPVIMSESSICKIEVKKIIWGTSEWAEILDTQVMVN